MTTPDLKEILTALVATTLDLIRQGRSDGTFVPSEQAYFRWRLQGELTYSERGVKLPPAQSETCTRPSWGVAAARLVQGGALQMKEYQAAVAALQNVPGLAQNAEQFLQQFILVVARKAFASDPTPPETDFAGLIQRFIDDIAGVPFECGAEVKLQGVALESDHIEPFPGIVLRRPKREDFEEKTAYFGPGTHFDASLPGQMSALATVTCKGTGPQDAQCAAEKLIAMLRLFHVASAKPISYDLFGDSIINFVGGRMTSSSREIAREIGFIRTSDAPRLRKFWQILDPKLPTTFYYKVTVDAGDYRDMAYERYSAALMHSRSPEERVANAIMSLEALLLNERQALAYRLGLRAAKVLCFLGEDALAVRDALHDGYNVRNVFSHGSRLSDKQKRKLEARHQSSDNFVRKMLNLARKAIVTSLLVPQAKDAFIALIDDALLDRPADDRLRQLLSQIADIV